MALTRLVNDYKDSVKVASTGANIDLGAAPNTLDGVNLALNDRVLVKDQSPSYLNGIYRVTTLGTGSDGSWSRSSDFNDWREISPGAMVFVEAGSINGNAFYFINGGGSNVTINTTAINFSNLYSVNGNITSFPGNVNIAGTLNVTGNIVTKSYETVTLTEYANVQNVAGNINVTNGGNINIGAGGNIYMGSTAIPRYRSGNTAPASPNLGDTWYQGNTDILYQYIQDANGNNYWLDLSSNPSSYGNLTVANTLTLNGNTNNYGTANLGAINQVIITGGTAGYVLSTTNGAGSLSWVPISATAGGSNTMVQFSDAGAIGGATFLQYNKTSGNLVSNSTTTSTSTTTGAIVAPSLGVSGNVNANAFYSNYYLYSNGSTITTPAGGGNTMVQFNDGTNFAGATYIQYNKTSGNLVSNSSTTSTSKTTGAIVVGGGVGIGGNLFANAIYSDYHYYANGNVLKSGSTFTTSNTAPSGPVVGDLWYKGNSDILYTYIKDANNNSLWFDISSMPTSFANLTVTNNLTVGGTYIGSLANALATGNLTLSGTLTASGAIYANAYFYSNGAPIIASIYDLDDLSNYVDSVTNTFSLTYNKANVTVLSPWQLTVTVNGQLQPAWAYNIESLWQSFVLAGNKGYTVVNYYYPNGTVLSGPLIKFADPLPRGSQVLVRTVTGTFSQAPKIYPFKPVDILLGAD